MWQHKNANKNYDYKTVADQGIIILMHYVCYT